MRKMKLTGAIKAKLKSFADCFHAMIIEYNEDDKLFCISFPDLPECVAKGKKLKDALKNIASAKWTWGYATLLNGHNLPKARNRRIGEQYVFILLQNEDRFELNKRAWENRKSPEAYAKSLIIEKINAFEKEIKFSDTQVVVATPQEGDVIICGITQKRIEKLSDTDASQIAFGA